LVADPGVDLGGGPSGLSGGKGGTAWFEGKYMSCEQITNNENRTSLGTTPNYLQ